MSFFQKRIICRIGGRGFLPLVLMALLLISQLSGAVLDRRKRKAAVAADTVAVDSVALDSIERARIAADTFTVSSFLNDSTLRDSVFRSGGVTLKGGVTRTDTDTVARKRDPLEDPVAYEASDSIVYEAEAGFAYLFGKSNVKYQNIDLSAEVISVNIDSSVVYAQGVTDSTGQKVGQPVFKQGSDEYESEEMSYNFHSRKGFITNVYTKQGEGFLTSAKSKKSSTNEMYIEKGKYTTCDHPEPHFYLALSRAKVRPKKDVVFGPAWLVVADVPLPFAIPFGFFPFSSKYSSGFIMPTYGDENSRGFYLRDGGYYFAISDKMDLKLTGEIYTKGSWGLNAQSNYARRYKYSGNFLASYLVTKTGDKNMPDYSVTKSFKLQWSHRQDAKANPTQTFSASVNFATSSYEHSNLTSLYNPAAYSQSTRTSSVSYSKTFSNIGLTLSGVFNLSQNMRDSSIAVTLPNLNITLSRFYPFKRKKAAGEERWYEKIAVSYTGQLSNSINTKEDKLWHSNLIKDWRNGMQHSIPISASFTLFKYINVTPQFNYNSRWYSFKENRSWDVERQCEKIDTIWGFNRVYNYNFSISANTKLYGFYKPWRKLFGDKVEVIRHVITPQVSYSYAPDFGAAHYGYWTSYMKTDENGNVTQVDYSPYQSSMYGVPGRGKTGSLNFDLSNNIEAKIKSDKDSTGVKKVSIIDELGASLSYNMAAATHKWSDLTTRIRIKFSKSYTFSLNATWATYAYEFDDYGNVFVGNRTEWSYGRWGRFQGMSQNISKTFNNDTFKKLFGRKDKDKDKNKENAKEGDNADNADKETDDKSNTKTREKAATDSDGYMQFKMPWSFTISYGVSMRENTGAKINPKTMRYPYMLTHSMNFSGNIKISDNWNTNFSSGWDFNQHKISMTSISISRQLHCFSMSCSVVLGPFTSYNFCFRCDASTLTDALKYEKKSSYSSNLEWY